jgi:hypothetical protein
MNLAVPTFLGSMEKRTRPPSTGSVACGKTPVDGEYPSSICRISGIERFRLAPSQWLVAGRCNGREKRAGDSRFRRFGSTAPTELARYPLCEILARQQGHARLGSCVPFVFGGHQRRGAARQQPRFVHRVNSDEVGHQGRGRGFRRDRLAFTALTTTRLRCQMRRRLFCLMASFARIQGRAEAMALSGPQATGFPVRIAEQKR